MGYRIFPMLITLINAFAVVLGTTIGLVVKKAISESFREIIMLSSGIITLILGFQMVGNSTSVLVLLFSLIIGGFIGYWLRIEDRIVSLGNHMDRSSSNSNFGVGFLTSSILFCSGAMSIVGSIDIGTGGSGELILIKSVMDGFMAIVLASTYGKGVYLSSLVIFIYQGIFVFAGSFFERILGSSGIDAMASAGGCLLIMISLGLINIKKIKTGNFLPVLLLAPLFSSVLELIEL